MQDELPTRLRTLQGHYVEAVNSAVAEGRDDIVAELVAEYPDAALRVLDDSRYESAA